MTTGMGMYPGGPRGSEQGEGHQSPPRLTLVRDLEEHIASQAIKLRRKTRRRRLVWAAVMGIAVAGGVGLALGYSAHPSPEEVVQESETERSPKSLTSEDLDRALMELWRMEDVEYARNTRGR